MDDLVTGLRSVAHRAGALRMVRAGALRATIVALLCVVAALTAAPSRFAHADGTPSVATIVATKALADRQLMLSIYSPSMKQVLQVALLQPKDTSRPRATVYLLDGGGKTSPETVPDWVTYGHADKFFADKDVNVVIPVQGTGTFYSNWEREDPGLGQPMWETFLTKELPPLIDSHFNGTGKNAVMGISMGAQAAMALLANDPEVYTGGASFSGCALVNQTPNQGYVYLTTGQAGGSATNMWGPPGSAGWARHDPSTHVDSLRGKNIYLSAGNGQSGPLDVNRQATSGQSLALTLALGDYLERGVDVCTREFSNDLDAAGIAHVANVDNIGTHSWPYWAEGLGLAWPTISKGL